MLSYFVMVEEKQVPLLAFAEEAEAEAALGAVYEGYRGEGGWFPPGLAPDWLASHVQRAVLGRRRTAWEWRPLFLMEAAGACRSALVRLVPTEEGSGPKPGR